ncbi:MAG: class I SAM-dependent methyltransferase [Phycisphaerales bacterium]|nr:class I SAM-dependent methyltransferase [Phycisphaerales bacterium]
MGNRLTLLGQLGYGFLRMCTAAARSPFDRSTRESFIAASFALGAYPRRPRLAQVAPTDLIDEGVPVQLVRCASEKWQVTTFELAVIVGVAKSRAAGHIFEIGTFDGRTTLNLHINMPAASLATIDLPPAEQRLPDGKVAGSLIREHLDAGTIKQLYGDSTRFDFSPYFGTQDLVFVDARHTYENVRSDSRTALRLVEGREGTILWHDYANTPGVTQAVEEVPSMVESAVTFGWIRGTSLAVLATAPGEPLRLR